MIGAPHLPPAARRAGRADRREARALVFGRGQMGSALMGSLQGFCLLTEVRFGYQSVKIYKHLSILRTLFPQSVKYITSAGTPLVLTPFVRNPGLAAGYSGTTRGPCDACSAPGPGRI